MNKLVRFAVSAILLGWIAWHTDGAAVARAFAGLRVELWLAAVGLLVLTQAVSAARWQLFARQLRFERSTGALFGYIFVGMYFNLLLPTSVGGDVVRAVYLDGRDGRRLAALAAVFLDRLNGLLVLLAMACVAVLVCPLDLPAWVPASVYGLAGCAALGLAALPLLARWKLLPAARQQQLGTMVQLLRAPRVLLAATGLSVVVQAANVVLVWLIGRGLGADVPFAYYWVVVPMVTVLTLLPSINGMGVREKSTALFLAPLGVAEPTAVALAVLWFAVFGAASLLGGAVYLYGAFPQPKAPLSSSEGTDAHGPVDRGAGQGREGQPARAA